MLELVSQLSFNALISGSIYALAAIGMSLSYGLLRVLNFAHGHLLMAGAYTFYFAYEQLGTSFIIATVWTTGIGILLTIVVFHLFVRPFLAHSFLLVLIVTLGLSYILESSIQMIFGAQVHSFSGASGLSNYSIGSLNITLVQVVILASGLLLIPVIAILIQVTSLGRKIRALSEHPQAAESLGIPRRRYQYGILILATLLSMFAGVLVAFDTNIQLSMGTTYTVKSFAAMVLGGLGNIWGTILGAYIIGFLENFGIGLEFNGYALPASYKDTFAYVVILLVLLLKPEGLGSALKRKV